MKSHTKYTRMATLSVAGIVSVFGASEALTDTVIHSQNTYVASAPSQLPYAEPNLRPSNPIVEYRQVNTDPAEQVRYYRQSYAAYPVARQQNLVTETYAVAPRPVVIEQPVVTQQYIVPQTYSRVVVRPSNCGVYHYWNGEFCADARLERPLEVRY